MNARLECHSQRALVGFQKWQRHELSNGPSQVERVMVPDMRGPGRLDHPTMPSQTETRAHLSWREPIHGSIVAISVRFALSGSAPCIRERKNGVVDQLKSHPVRRLTFPQWLSVGQRSHNRSTQRSSHAAEFREVYASRAVHTRPSQSQKDFGAKCGWVAAREHGGCVFQG
ncbi:hypothetical protein PDE_06552 [Penicillium oxalicum 114-2]|uniref:Uncharacterized protein n=1 Tax=Penicillium oxalicum (strain 114-2 / CGMCC 5302) TaxID=933388 RepID=S8B9W0_PENO1|nr:hypothetical protein PDE_06552 [Penicillium oxalicum 114-2]